MNMTKTINPSVCKRRASDELGVCMVMRLSIKTGTRRIMRQDEIFAFVCLERRTAGGSPAIVASGLYISA